MVKPIFSFLVCHFRENYQTVLKFVNIFFIKSIIFLLKTETVLNIFLLKTQ